MKVFRESGIRVLAVLLILLSSVAVFAKPAPRSPAPDRAGPTEIENPRALAGFFKALAEVKSGRRLEPVRVMHFGDSHVAADVLTAEIRGSLQAEFGDGGAGFIVPRNPMSTRRRGVSSGATAGWQIEGIGGRMEADAIYGPAGISLATSHANERIWLETAANHFEVYYARQPGGGQIDIALDGASVLESPLSLSARISGTDCFSFDTPADTVHRVEIRTLTGGKARILGIVAERLAPGVSYDVLGINGARVSRLLSWNSAAFAANLAKRGPDLIILAYGTNEVGDPSWTGAAYRRLLASIIRKLHDAAPQASILLFAPPDRADLPNVPDRMPSMINAQRRAANETNAALWSAFDAMGGPGSMNAWVARGLGQSDRVHLSRQGYSLLSKAFFADLMTAYGQSRLRTR